MHVHQDVFSSLLRCAEGTSKPARMYGDWVGARCLVACAAAGKRISQAVEGFLTGTLDTRDTRQQSPMAFPVPLGQVSSCRSSAVMSRWRS